MVSSALIPDPQELRLRTVIDGETRQEESVSDLLFDCAYLVSYLSQGTTLQKGSVIMTGTPGGMYLAPRVYLSILFSFCLRYQKFTCFNVTLTILVVNRSRSGFKSAAVSVAGN